MTNSPCVGLALEVRCPNDRGDKTPLLEQHKHVWLVSGRARATEHYPPKLAAAVLKAIRAQLQSDRNLSINALKVGLGPHVDEPEILPDIGGWAPGDEEEEAELPVAYN